jgi:hypothetical protein
LQCSSCKRKISNYYFGEQFTHTRFALLS